MAVALCSACPACPPSRRSVLGRHDVWNMVGSSLAWAVHLGVRPLSPRRYSPRIPLWLNNVQVGSVSGPCFGGPVRPLFSAGSRPLVRAQGPYGIVTFLPPTIAPQKSHLDLVRGGKWVFDLRKDPPACPLKCRTCQVHPRLLGGLLTLRDTQRLH